MDERKLRYFLAVIDEGSVTRAAAELRVAQPSLSQALKALEAEFGAMLFHRVGRTLRPSAAGLALIPAARQVMRDIDTARATVAEVSELAGGTLDLAALATLAVEPLAELIGRFRSLYPRVAVSVVEPDNAAGLGALVHDGSSEIGLAHLPLGDDGLVVHELGTQELLLVLPPGSEISHGPFPIAALADIPLVLSPPGTSTRLLLEQALSEARVDPRIAVEVSAREAIVPLVLAGAGAALLPTQIANEAARRGAVARSALPAITREIGLVHRDGPLSPAARAFTRMATESALASARLA
jgi:LysR family transcriptional regulator, carnitine catabolism transcriptional activator